MNPHKIFSKSLFVCIWVLMLVVLGTSAYAQGGTISGFVYESDGITPIANINIQINDYDTRVFIDSAQSQADGSYSISGIPTGTYRVWTSGGNGIYVGEFYDNTQNDADTTPVSVTSPLETSNINFTLDQGGTISGFVYESDGITPLENVWVSACPYGSGSFCGSAYTGADGSYSVLVPTGAYAVETQLAGYAREYYDSVYLWNDVTPVSVTAPNDTPGINFTLESAGTISGCVYASDGVTPLMDVEVKADDSTIGVWANVAYTWTQPDGCYTLEVPSGDYIVEIAPPDPYIYEYYNNTRNSTEASIVSIVAPASISGIDFIADQGGRISGHVYESDGVTPIAYAQVTACPASGGGYCANTQTQADGSYLLGGLDTGNFKVEVQSIGAFIGEYYSDTYDWGAATPVSVTIPNETSGIDFTLEQGGSISGHVYLTDGVTPLANVWVYANDYTTGTWLAGAYSQTDGGYSILLPPGDFRVTACGSCLGSQYLTEIYEETTNWNDAIPVTVTALTDTPSIDFTIAETGSISGTVYDVGIIPIMGQQIRIDVKQGSDPCNLPAWSVKTAYTNQIDGTYTIPDINPETPYYLLASDVDLYEYADVWWATPESSSSCENAQPLILTSAEQTTDIDFHLPLYQAPPPFETKWGTEGTGDGQFSGPRGIAVDSNNMLYVADSGNHRIQVFDSNGTYQRQWGSYGTASQQFNGPRNVKVVYDALLGIEVVYVIDTDNHRIQKFDTFGGYLGEWGNYGTGPGEFARPWDLALDSSGNFYVVDTDNHRIQKFDSNWTFQTAWGAYGNGPGQFSSPQAIAVDSMDTVYVLDSYNNRIQMFDTSGAYLGQWGLYGVGAGQLSRPKDFVIDVFDNIYIADTYNNRFQKFDRHGNFIEVYGSYGHRSGQFYSPRGIAVASDSTIYVSDSYNHRMQKFGALCLDCANSYGVTVGSSYNGTTVGGAPETEVYSCSLSWDESGPEIVHTVTIASPGDLTASLSALTADLDVFILDACAPTQCRAFGDNNATYANAPAGTYYIVVDGYHGEEGDYTLDVSLSSSVSISGYITDPGGVAIPGVALTGFPGTDIPVTDETGYYIVSGTVLHGQSWTVTPVKADFTFEPSTRTYTNVTTDQSDQDYNGRTYTIAGYIRDSKGIGIPGVVLNPFPLQDGDTITKDTSSEESRYQTTVIMTDETGYYSVSAPLFSGSGELIPTKAGYKFDPQKRTYQNVSTNQFDQDYFAGVAYGISGYVRDENGDGIEGVEMVMTGVSIPNPITDANGFYLASSWSLNGWSGTVTPTIAGYTFSPANQTYTSLAGHETDQNYTETTCGTPLTTGLYQETASEISYSGIWTSASGSGASGGAFTYTNDPAATASFCFTGTELTIVYTGYSNRGTMEVCVDGNCETFNQYSAALAWQQSHAITGLSDTTHTVTISRISAYVDLDAIQIGSPQVCLAAGLHQQTVPEINYTGTWTTSSASGANGGTITYTNDSVATASFCVTGTELTIYRTLYSNRGLMEVCVDGNCQNVDSYSATLVWSEPYTVSGLSAGDHDVTISRVSNYIDLDAVEVSDGITALPAGFYQQTDSRLSYSGAWASANGSGASGGTITYTNDPAATVNFSISGTGVTIYRTLYSNRGLMNVCVDGSCQNVNNYSASLVWAAPYTVSGLSTGEHSVTISNASTAYIDLDAVEVLDEGSLVTTVLPVGLHQENADGITYSGNWVTYAGSGPNGGTLRYTNAANASAQFKFEGTELTIYRTLYSNRGTMEICIDSNCQTVDNHSATLTWNVPVTFTGLGSGIHDAVIRNASTSYIDVDAIGVADDGDLLTADVILVVKTGNGTGTIIANDIICGIDCEQFTLPYVADTSVTLQVIPEPDSQFIGWQTDDGQVLENVFYAQPGETVLAVFEK